MRKTARIFSFLLIAVLVICCVPTAALKANAASASSWAGAWGSPAIKTGVNIGSDSALSKSGIQIRDIIPANSTVRTVITTTIGGTKIRLKFSNVYGAKAITINEATIAKTGATDDVVVKDSITQVTFNNGKNYVTIAAGSEVYSDPVNFTCTSLEKLSISTYYKNATPIYVEGLYGGTAYLCSLLGNKTHSENITSLATKLNFTSGTITYYTLPFLTRLDVYAPGAYSVVLIGDSTITNDSYILLEKKLQANGIKNVGVVMSGIIGNRLLYNGVGLLGTVYGDSLESRFDRDALDVAGAKYVILKVGLNDIIHPTSNSMKGLAPYASTDDIIAGYRRLANRAAAKGVTISVCELSPYKGYQRNFFGSVDLEWSLTCHKMIYTVNIWLKSYAQLYGFREEINLDKLVDSKDNTKIQSQLTSDGAHLSNKGQIAFVDLLPTDTYGVSGNLKTLQSILNIDPYAVKTTSASTTKPASTTAEATTKKASSSSGGSSTAAPTTNSSSVAVIGTTSVAGATQELTTNNANSVLLGSNETTAANGIGGTVSDDNASGSSTKQIVGFSILAVMAAAIIAVSVILLVNMKKKSPPLTRAAIRTTRKTKKKSII